jgi:NitT/TauT family transport system ATP-binding protein
VIEVSSISHSFIREDGSSLPVIDNVSMQVERGTFVSLLGPSGCGKTTLLRIMDGLIPQQRGNIRIDGQVVRKPVANRAMVFQEFNLMPWRTAAQNIDFAQEAQGVGAKERAERTRQALSMVGLDNFANYYPHQLSGGMKQRVGIARALSVSPDYIFMDEPFGALDPQIREIMQIDLLKLLERDKKTVVLVTHSIEEAIFLSDKIVMFSARPGRILTTIDIDLPHPRWENEEELKASPAFVQYRQEIWRLLKKEIARSISDSIKAA